MFGTFFRSIRILWRLFRGLPKWIQAFLILCLILAWVLGIMAAYGEAGDIRRNKAASPVQPVAASSSVAPSNGSTSTPASPNTPDATTPSPSATYHPIPGLARGCLGDSNPSEAVFAAQQQAPLSAEGAAEFAASYVRWAGRYPHIGNPAQQGEQLWAPDATDSVKSAGQWPTGMAESSVYVSTLASHYKVVNFDKNSATVALSFSVVSTTPQGSTSEDQANQLHLVVTNGHWHVQDTPTATLTPSDLAASGLPFVGGC